VVRVSDITGLSRYRNKRNALLSQEGSTIETAVEIVRGVVPEPHSLRMHSETFRLGNHPSRHRKEHDDAAPDSGGHFACISFTILLFEKSILDSSGLKPRLQF
jgi:hypothetical protein